LTTRGESTYNLHSHRGKGGKVFKRQENEKNKENMNPPQDHSLSNISSLGTTCSFKGEITSDEDLTINGFFQGKIDLRNHNLVVGKEGKIEADVQAKDVHILGKMKGNIYASGKVYIAQEAQVIGDISAFRISIMDGAQFKGSVKMTTSSQSLKMPEKQELPAPAAKE